MKRWLRELRTLLWHLRQGGIAQVRTYRRRKRASNAVSLNASLLDRKGRLNFEPWPRSERGPVRPHLRVAVILDDFTRLALEYEWNQVVLAPHTWREQLTQTPVDLLFVESAWHGNADAWQYHLTGPSAPSAALVELVNWCREHDVPTVFWNKEDPVHFTDFFDSAKIFDYVFTTDVNKVPEYRRLLGHDRVDTLMFAAQSAIHNPLRPTVGHQARDIAFAGMYFAHKYPERREQMQLLLGAADRISNRMDHGLEIYSRYLGRDRTYQFPSPLDARVVGSLEYEQMLTAYRAYKVFLNVNSVVDSPSMCARRIFEITASGTPVVSAPSPAIDHVFPDGEIAQVGTTQEAELTLRSLIGNAGVRDRLVHRAQRRIWREHTYSHRVDQVLDAVGRSEQVVTGARPQVTALVSTNRPHQVEHVLGMLGHQVGVQIQVALLAHGFEVQESRIRSIAAEQGLDELTLLTAPADVPLGECLNRLVTVADGQVLAKIDDDDHYGPHYLLDAIHALSYANADVVGKQAHYLYLGGADVMVLRMAEREHTYTDRVMGPTMVFTRDLGRSVGFQPVRFGEDTAFLDDTVAQGGIVYSADRFNFVQMRHSDPAEHTWAVADIELIAGGQVEVHGHYPAHVMV